MFTHFTCTIITYYIILYYINFSTAAAKKFFNNENEKEKFADIDHKGQRARGKSIVLRKFCTTETSHPCGILARVRRVSIDLLSRETARIQEDRGRAK